MIKKILLSVIKLYKFLVSPIIFSRCRFYPSCSTYSIQAIEKYNLLKGLYLTVQRILKCHPFNDGGPDPLK